VKRNLRYPGDINPDGLEIKIAWDKLVVGASVFIPAVNLTKLSRQISRMAAIKGIKIIKAERIENGKLGLRFWRVL
jgi:hypothetical protein